MTPQQAELLCAVSGTPTLIIPEQWDLAKPRTLLYGYTCDRDTFHVYVDQKGVHALVFRTYPFSIISYRSSADNGGLLVSQCAPDKRVYIEPSDFAFCRYLKQSNVPVGLISGGHGDPECTPYVSLTFEMAVAKAKVTDSEAPTLKQRRASEPFEIIDLNSVCTGLALKVYKPQNDNRNPQGYGFCALLNNVPTPRSDLTPEQRELAETTLKERFPLHAAALL